MSLLDSALSNRTESFLQFLTVVIIFIVVLGITYVATRWIAGYEKGRNSGSDVEVLETCRIAPNKYIQVLRIGERYFAIAVCKDTVSFLTELSKDDVSPGKEPVSGNGISFRELLSSIREHGSGGKPDDSDYEKN